MPDPISGWTFVVGQNNLGPQAELLKANNRGMTFAIDSGASLEFKLDGNDPALDYLVELVSDVWVYRNNKLFFRGRVGPTTDDIDENSNTVSVNVFDYREWLGRQILGSDAILKWVQKSRKKIINDMLAYLNNTLTGIKPTITLDDSQLSTNLIDFNVLPGTSIRDAIALMVGFGWQVVPVDSTRLSLIAVSPFYYRLNDYFVMEYGGAVSKVQRNLDTANFSNSIFATGDPKLIPVLTDSADIATDLRGRMGQVFSNPSIVHESALISKASSVLSSSGKIAADWKCTLTPGFWINNDDAWLGDIVRFVVNSGRVNLNDQYRITNLDLKISDNGLDHDVQITLVKPPYVPTGYGETLEEHFCGA